MSLLFSRRKFFGLFGGAVAAAAVPKPLMAMTSSMVVPESTAGNITIEMLQDAFAQTVQPTIGYIYIRYHGAFDSPPPMVLQPVFWSNLEQHAVSVNRRNGNGSIRPYAGRMITPLKPNHYGWIQV